MRYIFIFLVLISFLGCNETDNDDSFSKICSVDPIGNVEWLKELVTTPNPNGLEIIQYDYKEQTVFSINDCLNCIDTPVIVYDCGKNKICEFGGFAGLNTCPDFDTKAINEKVLFTDRNCEKGTIISSKLYKEFNPSQIISMEVKGNCLDITFSILSTQDRIEDVTLVASDDILESSPVQRRLKFSIKESLTKPTSISVTTSFNISNLAEPGETIILLIDGFDIAIDYTRIP